jgi:hypothetical protein
MKMSTQNFGGASFLVDFTQLCGVKISADETQVEAEPTGAKILKLRMSTEGAAHEH